MKIYNKDKTEIIENPNLEKGKLINDTIQKHEDEKPFVPKQSHFETVKEYPNGGKEVKEVVDVEQQEYQPAKDYEEDIQVYIPYTDEELLEIEKDRLRAKREIECFPVINRGKFWYDSLTPERLQELNLWYHAWLNVTNTLTIPEKLEWIK